MIKQLLDSLLCPLVPAGLLLLTLIWGPPAKAQERPAWRWSFTACLWAAGISGDNKIGRLPQTSVDMDFGDVPSDLNLALMGLLEARRGRWMVLMDGIYMSLSDSEATPGPLYGGADVGIEQQLYTLSGGYRVLEGPVALDALAGVHCTNIKTTLTLTPGILRERGLRSGRSGGTPSWRSGPRFRWEGAGAWWAAWMWEGSTWAPGSPGNGSTGSTTG